MHTSIARIVDHEVLGRETSYHKYTELESTGQYKATGIGRNPAGTAHGGLEVAKPPEESHQFQAPTRSLHRAPIWRF